MGHGKADEVDGAAIGGGDSYEQTGGEQKQKAGAPYVDAEIAGIAVAEKQGVEGLDETDGNGQPNEYEDSEQG